MEGDRSSTSKRGCKKIDVWSGEDTQNKRFDTLRSKIVEERKKFIRIKLAAVKSRDAR